MAGVLEIVEDDTKPTKIQFQESGAIMVITDFSVACRIGGTANTTISGSVTDGPNGEASIEFGTLSPGTYPVEIVVTDTSLDIQTSELFTVVVRAHL